MLCVFHTTVCECVVTTEAIMYQNRCSPLILARAPFRAATWGNWSSPYLMASILGFLCLHLSSFFFHTVIFYHLCGSWFSQLSGQICVIFPSSLCRPVCKCLPLATSRVQLVHHTSWCSCWKHGTFGWGWMETLAHLLNTNYQSGSAGFFFWTVDSQAERNA